MKTHTSEFKNKIKEFGREIDSKITYTIDGVTTELGGEELNSVSPHYEGAILKSVMKQLDIDSNVEIPIGTEINYKFGVKTRSGKNLLEPNFQSSTSVGATITYTDDGWLLNGTLTSSYTYFIIYNKNLPAGTYTINGVSGSANNTYQLALYKNGTIYAYITTTDRTFTLTEDTQIAIRLYVYSNYGTFNNLLLPYQLEKGNQATSYEPYGAYDYVDYGNYIVKDVEKQEDTNSYKITCYDKMLYSMKDYENSSITFPITVKNYLIAICNKIGLTFKDSNFANYDKTISEELYLDNEGNSLGYTFRDVLDEIAQVSGGTICISDDDKLEVRYLNQTIGNNLIDYSMFATPVLQENGYYYIEFPAHKQILNGQFKANTQYTISFNSYRTAIQSGNGGGFDIYYTDNTKSSIRTNTTSSTYQQLTSTANKTISYIDATWGATNQTYIKDLMLNEGTTPLDYEPYGDTIDEEYLKDVNVNFGEKYGPVNTIVLSRSEGSDKISLSQPTNLPDADKIAIQISDNQILNGNNRDTYMPALLNKLYGLEYYINDFSSTGICYLDLCDKYNIKVGDKFYSCIMLNDNVNITQGLEELIYTDMQEENEQEYKYMSATDNMIKKAYIQVNKQKGEIEAKVSQDDIIASLNLAIEDEQGIVRLTGNQVIIDSDYFKLNADGTIQSTGGTIGGYKIANDKLYSEFYAPYDFTQTDVDKAYAYVMGRGTLTDEEKEKYDINGDGQVNLQDVTLMYKFVVWGVTTTSPVIVSMNTGDYIGDNALKIIDGFDNEVVKIGLNGIFYKGNDVTLNYYSTNEIEVGKWIDGSTIYRKVFTGTSSGTQTNITTGISDFDKLIALYGSCIVRDNEIKPIPTAEGSDYINAFLTSNGATLKILNSNNDYMRGDYNITIEYTKTI